MDDIQRLCGGTDSACFANYCKRAQCVQRKKLSLHARLLQVSRVAESSCAPPGSACAGLTYRPVQSVRQSPDATVRNCAIADFARGISDDLVRVTSWPERSTGLPSRACSRGRCGDGATTAQPITELLGVLVVTGGCERAHPRNAQFASVPIKRRNHEIGSSFRVRFSRIKLHCTNKRLPPRSRFRNRGGQVQA